MLFYPQSLTFEIEIPAALNINLQTVSPVITATRSWDNKVAASKKVGSGLVVLTPLTAEAEFSYDELSVGAWFFDIGYQEGSKFIALSRHDVTLTPNHFKQAF